MIQSHFENNAVIAEVPYLVVGGGIVGASIAYGIVNLGEKVMMVDGSDTDIRASRGNFGLVWVESKGWDYPAYARLAQQTARQWDTLSLQLEQETDIDIGHVHTGGLNFFLDETARKQHEKKLQIAKSHSPDFDYEFRPREALLKTYPHLGKDVIGAYYCVQNGIANPLNTLYALWQGIIAKGGSIKTGVHITTITPPSAPDGVYQVQTKSSIIRAEKIILAMGLANQKFGDMVGLHMPIRSQRGQIVVTEKVKPLLDIPSLQIRQNIEGSIMMGETHEDDPTAPDTTAAGMQFITQRAIRIFPILAHVNVVRCWGAMRILTPDNAPIYAQNHNAYGVALHSGVTMCAYHAYTYAKYVVSGQCPPDIVALSPKRLQTAKNAKGHMYV